MRKLIWDVDHRRKIFYLIVHGRKNGYHLTNRLAKTFMPFLRPGILVDFIVSDQQKIIGNQRVQQVAYFQQIVSLDPFYIHYDLAVLRAGMREVLNRHTHYLFIDFEMTMPGYNPANFRSEIIQAGYVLAEAGGPVRLAEGFYVLPKHDRSLTKRTRRFLKIDEETFFKEALPYEVFYRKLKDVLKTYRPKLVVWGKNDLSALNDSYLLHEKKPLTHDKDFIDLLKLHKDYFNLRDDLGLFKAYQTYYQVEYDQTHDAKEDAMVTKYVFDAFVGDMPPQKNESE
ncbi:MAG: hypothetical protein EA375_01230 [Acholeplasmataceae bacterium]|nr:MAG: hypothetical protein EA375_01230 [Acholeplasmataceae bacterium]